jgi:hypothetical protein
MNIAGGLHPVVHLLGRATAQYKGVFADMNNGKSYPSAVFDPHYSFIHLLQTNRCPIPVLESSSTPAGAAVMRVSKVTSNCSLERCVLDFGLQVLAIPHNRDFLTIRCNTLLKCNTRAYRLTAFELGDHVAIHCQLSEQSRSQLRHVHFHVRIYTQSTGLLRLTRITESTRKHSSRILQRGQQKRLLLFSGAPLMHMDIMSPKTTHARSTSEMTS